MISKAVYVTCDYCGDPAEVVCMEGAPGARRQAASQGYVRKGAKDICPRHLPDEYTGEIEMPIPC